MATYIWLGIVVLAVIVEAVTTSLVSIWFAFGALVALISASFGASYIVQAVVFFLTSAIFLTIFLLCFKKKFFAKTVKTNVDSLVGTMGQVEERIPERGKGRVKWAHQNWMAEEENGKAVEKDEWIEIIKIEGVTLVCRKRK